MNAGEPAKILMVCMGNICRSPLAKGIFQKKINDNNLNVTVDGAGTGPWHVGEPPDERAQQIAIKYNIDISGYRARQFTVKDFDIFDKIYVMDAANFSEITYLARNDADRKKVDFILNAIEKNNKPVPDPYYGGDKGFETIYQLLDLACEQLIKQYK